ncbi:uncharacterized protein MELLADRAFT_89349 [Melampsora larici-populina 98AG31]|uniref:BTB domain-containing protein n=1 Tax=Melampsora larici-populina (strain 98AG31 / pathotype 3-4-7) TaxID=747676 RepID=F4R5T8_MELLP|nr:uncharacterized protein MELLADRAFT_89349 [Melampsora larici-populina 98AG31]EGG12197.1 hypothetical protein MELLADRAFT_89349 [Melampsora larici-populina 98AG31]
MYAGWNLEWEFHVNRPCGSVAQVISQGKVTSHVNPVEWNTIAIGRPLEVKKFLDEAGVVLCHDLRAQALHFTMIWSRKDPASELDALKREMAQMRAKMFEILKSASIDTSVTRLVFHSKISGTAKHLYVCSSILEHIEYFQKRYSPEYSETQHLDKSENHDDGIYCDDSNEEWDSDSDDFEPKKASRDKHIGPLFSMQCAALYFAPLQSQYQEYCKKNSLLSSEIGQLHQQWAEAHCTTHTNVEGCKTLTSPKSMYRLADTLMIPELKKICHKQIIDSLDKSNVMCELRSTLFEQHQGLRLSAYDAMCTNWHSFPASEISRLIKYLPKEESIIVIEYIQIYSSRFLNLY